MLLFHSNHIIRLSLGSSLCPPSLLPWWTRLLFHQWPVSLRPPQCGWLTRGTGKSPGASWVWMEERGTLSVHRALGQQDLHPWLDLCTSQTHIQWPELNLSVTNYRHTLGEQTWIRLNFSLNLELRLQVWFAFLSHYRSQPVALVQRGGYVLYALRQRCNRVVIHLGSLL